MKILYPDLVYGAIASSGTFPFSSSLLHHTNVPGSLAVTHAALSNWEYMDVIRLAAPEKCAEHLVNTIKTVDSILTGRKFLIGPLKRLFGLADIKHSDDFASVLEVSFHTSSTITLILMHWFSTLLARGNRSAGYRKSTITRLLSFARRLRSRHSISQS